MNQNKKKIYKLIGTDLQSHFEGPQPTADAVQKFLSNCGIQETILVEVERREK